MTVVLYSTGCPKCNVLKKKLEMKNVPFSENNSVEEMQSLGFQEVPKLSIDGVILDFMDALDWINGV